MTIIISFLAVLLLFSRPAHAYMDPGTGSLLLQVLLGGVAGLLVYVRMSWKKIKTILSRKK